MLLRLLTHYRTRANAFSSPILLCMGLLDELIVGIPFVAIPLLRDRLHLNYTQIGLLFTIAALSGIIIEPFINLLTDHRPKKLWILSGLLVLSGSFILIGNTSSYLLLVLAFAISYPAGGAAIDLAQAVLIDASPTNSPHTMTRWTLLSCIGDFLAPLVVSAFVALHLGWTELCWLATVLWLVPALLLAPLRFPSPSTSPETDPDSEDTTIWTSLREAIHDPLLLRWAALAVIPTMLDEVFLSFVVLYMHDYLHLSESLIALIVALQMLASFAGLFLLERLLKQGYRSPIRLLTWFSLATLFGLIGLLTIHTLWMVLLTLPIISFSCASWYPLAQAEAYARKPSHSGVVRVVISFGHPLDMALPGVIGLISASFGLLTGLAILGLAPLLMLLLLPHHHREKP